MIVVRAALLTLVNIITWVLLIRIILSFVISMTGNEIVYKIYDFAVTLTEPMLAPIRELIARLFPSSAAMPLDFSPLVLFLLLDYVLIPLIHLIF